MRGKKGEYLGVNANCANVISNLLTNDGTLVPAYVDNSNGVVAFPIPVYPEISLQDIIRKLSNNSCRP